MLHNYSPKSKIDTTNVYVEQVRKRLPRENITNEIVLSICEDVFFEDKKSLSLSPSECVKYIKRIYSCLRCELEIIQEFVDDDSIQEIMVNGKDHVFVERNGHIEKTDVIFDDKEQIRRIVQRLAAKVGREFNELNPIVDARLADGSRVNAVYDNIAINGPILNIRKFAKDRLGMEDLLKANCLTQDICDYLISSVENGKNIFISGGTSSGKTTMLNILSDYIPKDERIIVIEDSAELQIRSHENLVRLEAKQANAAGKGAVLIKDLIKTSLRMRPDRIIVGEVRGEEVVDMIAAMNTGHDGSLSTGHANSATSLLSRLESLYLAASNFPIQSIRSQIADAIDIIIQLKRFPDGTRKLVEIAEIKGIENSEIKLNYYYVWNKEQTEYETEQIKDS